MYGLNLTIIYKNGGIEITTSVFFFNASLILTSLDIIKLKEQLNLKMLRNVLFPFESSTNVSLGIFHNLIAFDLPMISRSLKFRYNFYIIIIWLWINFMTNKFQLYIEVELCLCKFYYDVPFPFLDISDAPIIVIVAIILIIVQKLLK